MMPAYLEVWKDTGPQLVPLDGDRVTIGGDNANDLALPTDKMVSRLHAVMERYPAGWSLRDLGSRNGSFVNGERVSGERALRPGDEVRLGTTRIVYRTDTTPPTDVTQGAEAAPELTRREREVLLALCRPVLEHSMMTEPLSVKQIADELVVSESAVKKHLINLYDKFGFHEPSDRRRGRLAAEAIRRGSVTIAHLRGTR